MPNSLNQSTDDKLENIESVEFETLDAFLASVEKRAYRMAYVATSNKEDALDIVQDAMITLATKYSQRNYKEWPPLFYRIVQNTIRDWYRRQSVRNKFRQWFGSSNSGDSDTEADWESQAMLYATNIQENPTLLKNQHDKTMLRLVVELNQLPIRQQQAFLLRCWEGLDTKQTAMAMSITAGSVKTHYSRAIHALRKKLGEHYGE